MDIANNMRLIKHFFICLNALFIFNSALAQDKIWQRHEIDSSFSGADGVRLADVNGDHLPDIATGWEEAGFSKIYLHPGHAWVKENWPSVIVGKTPSVEDAVFADLDEDGAMDVITSTEKNIKKVYINWGPKNQEDYLDASKWATQVLPASDGLMQWMFAIPAQIDGINGIDIVVGAKNREAKIGWFQAPKNAREISEWSWHPISSASWVMSLFLKDMDLDGDMDIITSDRKQAETNGVRWMENPGEIIHQKKEWKNHFIGAKGLEVMFMDIADLDGDGLEDIVVTERSSQRIFFIRKLDKSGFNWKSYSIVIPEKTGSAKAVKVGDINGDGKLDLVHSTNTMNDDSKAGIYWVSYTSDPTDNQWTWHELSGSIGYKFDRIELLDLDGDGDLDVLTTEENYGTKSKGLGVIWYENPINDPISNLK
jgi:hypothetical protein